MAEISASAKRPRMRSISRVPRCQQRNNSRLRRSSRPSLDRVDPVIDASHSNAKSPDVPGGVDIATGVTNVSPEYADCRQCWYAGLAGPTVIACDKREAFAQGSSCDE